MAARIMGLIIAMAALAIAVPATTAEQGTAVSQEQVARAVQQMWPRLDPAWQARVDQDETQRICSATRNQPSPALAAQIVARERATVMFPADGHVLGDWRAGELLAQTGTGGQFSDADDAPHGGNCYACHQMAASEVSYGTLGPSLLAYGRNRNFDAAEARAAFAKIYNAQSVLPCSTMPRFGFHEFLTQQQIKDLTAYLFDPQSPVNR